MRRLLVVLVPVLALALAACQEGEVLGCKTDANCPSGHVCVQTRCAQLCQTDQDCVHGSVCVVDVCEAGQRTDAPRVDAVFGNGSQACPDAVGGYCFADGLKLQGGSLTGASFRLEATGAGESFDLPPSDARTDTEVTVMLPQGLYEGTFTLVAMNAIGSDQVSVQILRGEAGPAGPDMTGNELVAVINSEATTSFAVSVMPAANDLINHLNRGSVKLDPAILPEASGGTAYTGNDIVNLINNGATTVIDADELATPDGLMARINSAATTLLAATRLPLANDLIARINGGDGTLKISSTVLPAGTGAMTGNQIVTAINDAGTTGKITIDNLVTGTDGSSVALGNHTHAGAGTTSFHKQATPGSWTSGVTISGTDLTTVKTLCGDPGGCAIQMGVRYSRTYIDPTWYDMPAIMYGPPCRLHIDSANHWMLSPWCLQPIGTFNAYASDQFDTLGGGYGTYLLLAYAVGGDWACYLSEGPPSGADDGSLHFWMANINNTSFQNTQAARTCELHISP